MIADLQESLLNEWRQCIARRQSVGHRPLAALGYMADGPILCGLVNLERLTLVVLYDELLCHDQLALRLAGYSGTQVPWGVMWGGSEQNRFLKDLSLQPVPQGRGLRLDLARPRLLRVGLQLERELDRCARHPSLPRRPHLHLPCLWAGFRAEDRANVVGDGPELEAYASRRRSPLQKVFADIRREHLGLSLYPLAWVSHHWQQASVVFADLARFPKRQIFCLDHLLADLVGYQDAAEFDFVHSRFRRETPCRRHSAMV